MSAKPKKGKPSVTAEKFLPPDMEAIELHEDILFNAALNNDYTTICGALDAKDHPLTTYMIENNLFNKRNKYGKNFADLSANLGNKEFIRLMLERLGDRVDENAFNLKAMLSLNNSYNFMHYACIWGQTELVKFLVDYAKMIADPTDPQYESISMTNTKDKNSNLKPIGSVLLKLRTRETKETPLMLAERYKHQELVEFLNYAGLILNN
jgi:ankyrin repeat protein